MNIPSLLYICLDVEECKWLSIIADEISLITLFDITACIQAKQFSHEDSSHLAVPLECNGIASFDRAKFPTFEGSNADPSAFFQRWSSDFPCGRPSRAAGRAHTQVKAQTEEHIRKLVECELHTKLTICTGRNQEHAKCVDEILEMNCAAKKFLILCRETFTGRDFNNRVPGRQKHICSSNKMHRLVHGGEQVTKFGNVENFLAMAEIVHKMHIKGPQCHPIT